MEWGEVGLGSAVGAVPVELAAAMVETVAVATVLGVALEDAQGQRWHPARSAG